MKYLIGAALALVLLSPGVPFAWADNSAQAHRVMVCTWTFNGDAYSLEMADLDTAMSASERTAFEAVMLNDEMREMAGIYHKEYADYPNQPATVHKADMMGWRCTWTEK